MDEIKKREREEKRRKNRIKNIKLTTMRGTILVAASLAAELCGANLVKPLNVSYYFTSDNVEVHQEGNDYTDKTYKIHFPNGEIINYTFESLEKIEPEAHGSYTTIPSEYLPEGQHLDVMRTENNPVKKVLDGSALFAFLSGSAMVGNSFYEKHEMRNNRRR